MTSRHARLARAALAAGFTTFVAALSHSLAGAEAPGSLAVVLSLTFSLLVCLALTSRGLSAWRLSIAVIVSQLAYHGLFTLFEGDGGSATSLISRGSPLGGHAHMHATAELFAAGPSSASGTISTGMVAGQHGIWMPVAHALAALITIAALRYGERAFWQLVDDARIHVRALFTPIPVLQFFGHARIRILNGRDAAFPRELDVLISPMRHRGPPVLRPIR